MARLQDGSVFTPANGTFLDISQPIEELRIGQLAVSGAQAYYLVFHAVARPGQSSPTVRAVEFGGIYGDEARGYLVTPLGAQAKTYPLAGFPYTSGLRPGTKIN